MKTVAACHINEALLRVRDLFIKSRFANRHNLPEKAVELEKIALDALAELAVFAEKARAVKE